MAGKEAGGLSREQGAVSPSWVKSADAARRRPGSPAWSREAGSGCHSFSLLTCGAGEPVRDGPAAETRAGAAPFFQRRYAPIMNFFRQCYYDFCSLERRFSHKCSLVLSPGGRGALFSQSSFKITSCP